jgi:Fur family zinc uptake transcriptional regulator
VEEDILRVLAAAPRTLGAYDLLAAVTRPGEGRVFPNQIYRALRRLVGVRLVARVESLSRYVPQREAQPLLLVCTRCGAVFQPGGTALHRALCKTAEREGFVVGRTIVEALGRCAGCAAGRGERPPPIRGTFRGGRRTA